MLLWNNSEPSQDVMRDDAPIMHRSHENPSSTVLLVSVYYEQGLRTL